MHSFEATFVVKFFVSLLILDSAKRVYPLSVDFTLTVRNVG